MSIPEPFTTAITITSTILTNIASDILEYNAHYLEGTLTGRILKRVGLIEPNFDDRICDTLCKTLTLYFEMHPQYALSGIEAFFRDPAVARQIGGYILDRQPFDENQIQQAFDRHLNNQGITKVLMHKRGLMPQKIIPDFLECYHRVLSKQLSIPQMAILLALVEQTNTVVAEIKASEKRLQNYIDELLKTRLSPSVQLAIYQSGQQELAKNLIEEMNVAGLFRSDQAIETIETRIQSLPSLFTDGICKGGLFHAATEEYFVSHGFDRDTLDDWRSVLAQTLTHASNMKKLLKPYFSGDTLLGGFRLCGICEKLYTTRFSIFLLPWSQDRNVYLELGIAIGLGAPFFLIKDYEADIPLVLNSLSHYAHDGVFYTMRRNLPYKIKEYDFGVVRFVKGLPAPGSQPKYLIGAGGLFDDQDFEISITDAIRSMYPHLEASTLSKELGGSNGSDWMLKRLVDAIQTARFAIYRVDEACSPTTFLALGISISLNRPFLMTSRINKEVPLDVRGIGIYRYPNFMKLEQDIVSYHRLFFEKYT